MQEKTIIYEREIDIPLRISKRSSEEVVKRKIEKWPKEAGLSLPLDDSGINFTQMVKSYAADYELELVEKKWDTKVENDKYIVNMEWKMLRKGEEKGVAHMTSETSTKPVGEDTNNYVYNVKVKYVIEISSEVVREKALVETIPDLRLFQ